MANPEQEGVEAKIAWLVQEAIEQRLGPIVERLSPLVTQTQANQQPTGGEFELLLCTLPSGGPSAGRGDESSAQAIISANLPNDPDRDPLSGGATSHPRSQSYRPTFRTTRIAPFRREGRRVIRAVNHIIV